MLARGNTVAPCRVVPLLLGAAVLLLVCEVLLVCKESLTAHGGQPVRRQLLARWKRWRAQAPWKRWKRSRNKVALVPEQSGGTMSADQECEDLGGLDFDVYDESGTKLTNVSCSGFVGIDRVQQLCNTAGYGAKVRTRCPRTCGVCSFSRWGPTDRSAARTKTVTRKNLHALSDDEQRRFVAALHKMMEGGPDSPFSKWAGYHGYPNNWCVHSEETFPAWHRVYLSEFEQALQDAHALLYDGDRSIALPYWDWLNKSADFILPPIVRDGVRTFGTVDWTKEMVPKPSSARCPRDDSGALVGRVTTVPLSLDVPDLPFSLDVPDLGAKSLRHSAAAHRHSAAAHSTAAHSIASSAPVVLAVGAQDIWDDFFGQASNKPPPPPPTAPRVRDSCLLYEDGYKHPPDADVLESAEMDSARHGMAAFLDRHLDYPHSSAVQSLEAPHNEAHGACGFPMPSTVTASWSLLFWLHHVNVDRVWEAYLTARGSAVAEDDFRTNSPDLYHTPLVPFIKADGTPFSAADTFSIGMLGYSYDRLPQARASTVAAQAKKYEGTLVWGQHDPANACGIDLAQPSFTAFFFAFPKGALPTAPHKFVLPTSDKELLKHPNYVGSATIFGGDEGEHHALHKVTTQTPVSLDAPFGSLDVKVIYRELGEVQALIGWNPMSPNEPHFLYD